MNGTRRRALAALALLLAAPPAAPAGATFGEHGMALFGGKDGLYASHLPMFHAPHDYQVILQVHVADPAVDAALRQRLDGKTALWTVAPEPFELNRLAPRAAAPLTQFKADLVLGHFEQGGKTQYAAASVVVDKVVMFRQLSPARRVNSGAIYWQVGAGRQRFLIKRIDSRPDFEHILAYTAASGAPGLSIAVPKHALQETSAGELAAALHIAPSAIGGTVYFSTEDLR